MGLAEVVESTNLKIRGTEIVSFEAEREISVCESSLCKLQCSILASRIIAVGFFKA